MLRSAAAPSARSRGTIAIMVGGDKKVFDDALPVLQSFSANVIHMGELGIRHGGQAGQQHDGLLQRRRRRPKA